MHPSLDPSTRADWFLDLAKHIDWMTPPTQAENVHFDAENPSIRWYEDGVLNLTTSCLDRHLAEHGDKTALIWEADEEGDEHTQRWTYQQLHNEVCRLGNAMRNLGVRKGDRVALYLPLIPQAAIAMLACARIGAIHSVVFGGFSAEALANRLYDCQAKILITADVTKRGGKAIPLKSQADIALRLPAARSVETVIVVDHDASEPTMKVPRDRFWHHLLDGQPTTCTPEPMQAEDPLFVLYESDSNDSSQGSVHSLGSHLAWAANALTERQAAKANIAS